MSEQPEEQRGEQEARDEDEVARRAYEISQSPDGGTPEENWLRAEREVRGEAHGSDVRPEA